MAAGSPIPTVSQVAMTTVPTLIAAVNINRKRLSITPLTPSVDVYIGPTTVLSSTNGYPILARTALNIDAGSLTTSAIYGVSTAAATVGVLGY